MVKKESIGERFIRFLKANVSLVNIIAAAGKLAKVEVTVNNMSWVVSAGEAQR